MPCSLASASSAGLDCWANESPTIASWVGPAPASVAGSSSSPLRLATTAAAATAITTSTTAAPTISARRDRDRGDPASSTPADSPDPADPADPAGSPGSPASSLSLSSVREVLTRSAGVAGGILVAGTRAAGAGFDAPGDLDERQLHLVQRLAQRRLGLA